MYLPLIAIFIVISGGMGVSYMAADSLPGDPLYSVKVRVNEEVKHMVALRSEAEARVSAEIITRRAQEARRLMAEGRLDGDTKKHLAEEIQTELKSWNKATSGWINSDDSSSQSEARTSFESQAKANADIFQYLGVSVDTASSVSGSPSVSVFLDNSSANGGATSSAEGNSGTTNINASTSLDASQVINTE